MTEDERLATLSDDSLRYTERLLGALLYLRDDPAKVLGVLERLGAPGGPFFREHGWIGHMASALWWRARCRLDLSLDAIAAEARGYLGAPEQGVRELLELAEELGDASRVDDLTTWYLDTWNRIDIMLDNANVGVLMSEVQRELVDWQWQGKLALGKIHVVEGPPDVGKTTLVLDIAARISTGAPMPGETESREPGGVVIVTSEDGLGDTILPRLEVAGADLHNVVAARPDESPSLDDDGLNWLRRAGARVQAKLIILDPFVALLPGAIDAHRDQDVRRLFRGLRALAEELGVAIVLIRHLRKAAAASPKDAGGGSVGIGAAARVVMLCGVAPDDPERRALCRVKGNLAPPWPSLEYRLVPALGTVRIDWIGESAHTAETVLSAAADAAADRQRARAAEAIAERRAARAEQRARLREDAAARLAREVVARAASGTPLLSHRAEALLRAAGLSRDEARVLLDAEDGGRWMLRKAEDEQGRPVYVEAPPRKQTVSGKSPYHPGPYAGQCFRGPRKQARGNRPPR